MIVRYVILMNYIQTQLNKQNLSKFSALRVKQLSCLQPANYFLQVAKQTKFPEQIQQKNSRTKMMKPLLSMPSTKAEQYLYTDFSIITPPEHPKNSINKLLAYLRNLLKYRLYLCPSDIEELFSLQPAFLNTYLHVDSAEELWSVLIASKNSNTGRNIKKGKNIWQDNNTSGYADKLEEREIVSLFTKLILQMTQLKNKFANNAKTAQKFAEMKNLVEWLQEKVVGLQAEIRDNIKARAIENLNIAKQVREKEFQAYETSFKDQMDEHTKYLENEFEEKQWQEIATTKHYTQQKIKEEMYIHKPSKNLSKAKDISLLVKLAPYKSQKKRPYECRTLQDALAYEVEEDKQRMKEDLKKFRQIEQQRLKTRQQKQKNGFLSRMYQRNRDALSKLSERKEELDKSEQVKLHRLLQQNDKATRIRVNSLRNSLKGYSQRDETKQINRIMKEHRETIQFVNDIDEIGDTSLHRTIHDDRVSQPRYQTIDIRDHLRKQRENKRNNSFKIESKILKKVRNQSTDRNSLATLDLTSRSLTKTFGLRTERKSLADLYDTELKQY